MAWRVYDANGLEKVHIAVLDSSILDTDGTLAANSDLKVASQKATKTYITTSVANLQALAFLLASNNVVNGTGDFTTGKMLLPTAIVNVDGSISWDTTNDVLGIYDGSINRALNNVGWVPHAGPLGVDNSQAFATATALAAAGGTALCPVYIPAQMQLISVTFWNTDTTLARTWGWDLYVDRNNTGSVLNRVATGSANETFTAAAASRRTITASGSPVQLGPGLYFLAIQNRHASNTLGFGNQAGGGTALNLPFKTKTTTNPNGSTLDPVTATWSGNGGQPGIQLKGNIAGAAW